VVFARIRGIAGFSLAESLVVLAAIGIMSAIAIPAFVTYWQAQAIRAGALEVISVLNRGRQLAITNNTTVCVAQNTNRVRLELNVCGAAPVPWTGPGTNGQGWFTLANNTQVINNPGVAFTRLGGAAPAGQYTVQVNNRQTTVTVAASGRITSP